MEKKDRLFSFIDFLELLGPLTTALFWESAKKQYREDIRELSLDEYIEANKYDTDGIHNILTGIFTWSSTPQGYDFWNEISHLWNDMAEDINDKT